MATSRAEIEAWLREGRQAGATHTVICCDTFDHSDYPVHVKPEQNVELVVAGKTAQSMTRVMEVYCLGLDLDEQLRESRAWHTEYPPDKPAASDPPAPPERRGRISPLAI